MNQISAEHLIVGAGLLGLALAQRLHQKGAEGIVILEKEPSVTPTPLAARNLVLRSGSPSYRDLEDVGLEQLRNWSTWLEADPGYQPLGSLRFPVFLESEGTTMLGAEEAGQHAPGLQLESHEEAVLEPDDGTVDAAQLLAELHSEARQHGFPIRWGSELSMVQDEGSGVEFRAGSWEGTANRVYLTAGSGNLGLLRSLGLPRFQLCAWHTFELDAPPGPPSLLRLEEEDDTVIFEDGQGTMVVVIPATPSTEQNHPPVDWNLLAGLRQRLGERIPRLAQATVARARAEHRLDLDPRSPGIVSALGGRLLAAGGFGLHRLPLSLAIAEAMIEADEPGTTGD